MTSYYVNSKVRKQLIERERQCLEMSNPLGYITVKHGMVIPWRETGDTMAVGGVFQQDGTFVSLSANEDAHPISDVSQSKCHVTKEDTVIFLGNIIPVWGHAITDCLKKIWFLYSSKGQELIKAGTRLVCIVHRGQPLPQYIKDLFNLCGVNSVEEIIVPTQFGSIIVPENSITQKSKGVLCFHHSYIDIIRKIVDNAEVSHTLKYDKVYFTRTKLTSNRDKGEEAIERVFENSGYKVISPEQHSILDQISILRNCSVFVATEGSVSHSCIFCKPKTNVIILRKSDWINYYQLMINQAAMLNVTFIDVHHSVRNSKAQPWAGPFFLCVTKHLEKFMGHSIPHRLLWLRTDWLWYLCGKYRIAHYLNHIIHRLFIR